MTTMLAGSASAACAAGASDSANANQPAPAMLDRDRDRELVEALFLPIARDAEGRPFDKLGANGLTRLVRESYVLHRAIVSLPLHRRDNGPAATPPYAGVDRIRFSGSWAAAHLSAAHQRPPGESAV